MPDTGSGKKELYKRLGTWGTAVILIVLIHLWVVSDWWLGLFVSMPLLFVAFYLISPPDRKKKLSEWFVNHALTIATWFSAWIIAVCLVLWLLVVAYLDPMFARQTTAVLLDEAGVYVTAGMETAVAADGQHTEMR